MSLERMLRRILFTQLSHRRSQLAFCTNINTAVMPCEKKYMLSKAYLGLVTLFLTHPHSFQNHLRFLKRLCWRHHWSLEVNLHPIHICSFKKNLWKCEDNEHFDVLTLKQHLIDSLHPFRHTHCVSWRQAVDYGKNYTKTSNAVFFPLIYQTQSLVCAILWMTASLWRHISAHFYAIFFFYINGG